jgi:hypothetical protein
MKIPKPPDTATHIYFRQSAFDTQPFHGGTTYTFFNDSSEYSDERAIRIPEQQMVYWLFNMSGVKDLILEELDISPNCIHFLEVKEPIINGSTSKPGDIDVILCNKKYPQFSIALECKRVKVHFDESKNEYLNKVEGLMRGVHQANALFNLGFHKCYIFVMIITDGQNLKEKGQLFRYASMQSLNRIYNFDGYLQLHEKVGIVLCPVTQPSGKSYNMNNTIAVRVHHPAGEQEQPSELTEKILTLLKR